MAEAKDRVERQLTVLEPRLPAVAVDQMSPAELLMTDAVLGLRRIHDILDRPMPEDLTGKDARLIGDMAVASGKLYMRAAEADFRAKRNDQLGELLEMLREATEKTGKP